MSSREHRRVTVTIAMVTWLPLLALSALEGLAFGSPTAFLHDPMVHVRFLIALPLLWFARTWIDVELESSQIYLRRGHFIDPGPRGRRFLAELERSLGRREVGRPAGAALALAYGLTWGERFIDRLGVRVGDWHALADGTPSAAEYGRLFVSAPIFNATLALVAWRVVTYVWLLFKLRRTFVPVPGHPDEMSGLFNVARVSMSFAPVVLAIGALIAASMHASFLAGGPSVLAYRGSVVVFAIIAPMPFVLPLFLLLPRLVEKKRSALLEYGVAGAEFARRYEPHLHQVYEEEDSPVADEAVSTDADLGSSYTRHRDGAVIPIARRPLMTLVLTALAPFIILSFVQIGWRESIALVSHLREAMLG